MFYLESPEVSNWRAFMSFDCGDDYYHNILLDFLNLLLEPSPDILLHEC
jgi:hypothetical protein